MRRSDREITDVAEILGILGKCDVCRLALCEDNFPYIVPMNYGFEYADGNLVLYFHAAKEGRKLDMIRKNPNACFEVDCSHRLIEADKACEFSFEYESVTGDGAISFITDKAEKTKALKQFMRNFAKDREFTFPDRELESVTVFKLVITGFSGKRCVKH